MRHPSSGTIASPRIATFGSNITFQHHPTFPPTIEKSESQFGAKEGGKKAKFPSLHLTAEEILESVPACAVIIAQGREVHSEEGVSMSGVAAQYEERGGLFRPALHASSDTMNSSSGEAQSNPTTSTTTSLTQHDFRFPRRPADAEASAIRSATSQSGTSRNKTKIQDSRRSPLDKLDLSGAANNARKELLRESFFPTWKDDAAGEEVDSPDEMQKKDPLATQIWRLYSKTKNQLPNQERMENLTWRMMAMSLRKRRQEEAARYDLSDNPTRKLQCL